MEEREQKERSNLEGYLYAVLSRGVYTRYQLECKLRQRSGDEDMISDLLDTCEQAGYIDDEVYARLFVESRDDWSCRRLVDELSRRGIDRNLAKGTVIDMVLDEDERVRRLASEWVGSGVEPRKAAGRLLRRGFPPHLVREILEDLE